MKVMTIVGTRPEVIRLSRTIQELDRHVDHVLVHTGQNYDYELNEICFRDLELRKPDHVLKVAADSLARTIGNIIALSDEVMEAEKPDALLLLGDTNSCLAAISAKRRKIPIFHAEAGNRCFDFNVPEEINRRIVDHIADINLTYTEHARRYLLAEGLPGDRVIKVGGPMKEVLAARRDAIEASAVLSDLGLEPGGYFVASAHREENVDDEANLGDLITSLGALADADGKPIVFSTHPRTRKRLEARGGKSHPSIRFLPPLGFLDYVKLQQNAACVLSDSGGLTEEASVLGFPAVTIRQVHERPEGNDEGTLIMCGLRPELVLPAVAVVMAQAAEGRPRIIADYDVDDFSRKVARIILGYTDFVNRTVWRKGRPPRP